MNVAFLTTDTLHHAHFLREFGAVFRVGSVFLETRSVPPAFPCAHPFEVERDEHERKAFFGGRAASVKDYAACREFADMGTPEALAAVRAAAPDALLVFGTGKLKGDLLEDYAGRIVNLHGGDPEEYRGLDTHLWAIYHKDFGGLVTTLHHLERDLDTGGIIQQGQVRLRKGMGLHELRAANTRTCLDLSLAAFAAFEKLGRFPARNQRRKGRYYSAMPAVLKDQCVRKFAAHTAGLP